MDNYVISDQEEIIDAAPRFPNKYVENVKIMKINKNTRFKNVHDFVDKLFSDPENRHVIFEGVGDAADKCIGCVEVYKRNSKNVLYQWNSLNTAKRVSYWDPTIEGLQRLKVTVDTPVMHILLSLDPYPCEDQCLSMQTSSDTTCQKSGKSSRGRQWRPNQRYDEKNSKWARPDKNDRDAVRQEEERQKEDALKELRELEKAERQERRELENAKRSKKRAT